MSGQAFANARRSSALLLTLTYKPLIRGYFAVAAVYYGLITIANIVELEGADQWHMAGATSLTCIATLLAFILLKKPLPIWKLELVTTIINVMVVANIIIALNWQFATAKLTYFILATMIFAFTGVSLRQSAFSIVLGFGGFFFQALRYAPEALSIYVYLAFAAALSSLTIAYFLRRTMGMAVDARDDAELAKTVAENRLSKAQALGENMRRQSLADILTGLPNRRAFFEMLSQFRQPDNTGGKDWLCLLDLDGFKAVNDNYGHLMGDAMLKEVARRLKEHCGDVAHVSRMGGDEFAILAADFGDADGVEAWCGELLEKLAEVYLIDDRLVQISSSIGCYRINYDEKDAKLIQKADFALLSAKRNGKNRVVMFSHVHAQEAAEKSRIEQALRAANFETELELAFQPQYDIREDGFVRAEVLARWNSPELGSVSPDRFIEIAEASGLIARITLSVLRKTIATLQSWTTPIPLSMNLSGNDLLNNQVIDDIIAIVAASGIDAKLLEFEVTETAMMTDLERAKGNLLKLAELGHPIALDDFGTGYSNFNYLRSLPITKLKVDRSFMNDLGDPMTEKMLQALVGMASTLNVPCLLEGIEDELGLVSAKRVGAHAVQGFLFGKPVAVEELQRIFTKAGEVREAALSTA